MKILKKGRHLKVRKILKKISLVLALVLVIASLFTGCTKTRTSVSTSNGKNGLSPVTLKMYLLGDKPKDFERVYAEVNKLMKQKINATLDVQFIPWGDLNSKYPLLFSSGEDFDLIFTAAGWCFYNQIATSGGFLELTPEMLQKYAPNTWKYEPKLAWDQAKVNGKIYMVPNDQKEYGYNVIGVRGDLMEKYGISDIKSEADLEKYYDAILKNEKGIVPIVNGGGQNLEWPYLLEGNEFAQVRGTGSEPLFVYKITDSSGKILSIVDTPEFKDYVLKMRELAVKGVWSKNSISSKETRDDAFKAGRAASMVWNLGTVSADVTTMNKEHPEWKARVVDIHPGVKKLINPYTNNGIAINANSKNPERALMAIDLLRYDRDIHDLATYGIKGVHWEPVGDTQYKLLPGSVNFSEINNSSWGWHTHINRTDANQPEIVKQLTDKWTKEDLVHHPLEGFTFDDSKVKNEMAAINNVVTQYGLPLNLGMISDPIKGIETYRQKLKAAGLYKVLEEIQKQADQYMKEHK
ncbi:ABC transporter substrate-binding protein [Caldanaerobius polysaccharolyticus]|uniref:ABC transporter substrate-binding protein n=1 Tax=Caldanaerobius polysaccharolyticus TaxID=44256 RepID=UPI00068EE37B|nr:ABC transporter substrate-binding protein [Caldanaerobius polysaccharolyticus]